MANSVLPLINIEETVTIESYDTVVAEAVTNVARKKSFNFDFTAGDFVIKDGKVEVIEGIEALKIWILKLIKTEKFKFKIYETGLVDEYGITLLDLIHGDYPYFFIKSEIQRELTEGILKNTEVLTVTDFVFIREKRTLSVTFNIKTIYGTTEIGVNL